MKLSRPELTATWLVAWAKKRNAILSEALDALEAKDLDKTMKIYSKNEAHEMQQSYIAFVDLMRPFVNDKTTIVRRFVPAKFINSEVFGNNFFEFTDAVSLSGAVAGA